MGMTPQRSHPTTNHADSWKTFSLHIPHPLPDSYPCVTEHVHVQQCSRQRSRKHSNVAGRYRKSHTGAARAVQPRRRQSIRCTSPLTPPPVNINAGTCPSAQRDAHRCTRSKHVHSRASSRNTCIVNEGRPHLPPCGVHVASGGTLPQATWEFELHHDLLTFKEDLPAGTSPHTRTRRSRRG